MKSLMELLDIRTELSLVERVNHNCLINSISEVNGVFTIGFKKITTGFSFFMTFDFVNNEVEIFQGLDPEYTRFAITSPLSLFARLRPSVRSFLAAIARNGIAHAEFLSGVYNRDFIEGFKFPEETPAEVSEAVDLDELEKKLFG
jgi:hypothetical protein